MFSCVSLMCFRYFHETWCKIGQPGGTNANVRATKLCQNFLKRTIHLGAIRTISLLHEIRCKMGKTGAFNAKVRATPLEPKLMFWCVSFRLGAFGTVSLLHETYCKTCHYKILAAKCAKLVQLIQKFVPQSRVIIFCNECSLSTPLDKKLMFLCVSFCSGAFGTVMLLHENTPN